MRCMAAGLMAGALICGAARGEPGVKTGDGLELGFTEQGQIRFVAAGGAPLVLSGPGGFSIEEMTPTNGARRSLGAPDGSARESWDGGVLVEGRTRDGSVGLRASFRGGDCIDARGEVEDLAGKDRALVVTFTLPVNLAGWRWENTLLRGCRIEPGRTYPSGAGDVLYLGKKDDGFSNEDPAVYPIAINKLPLSSVASGAVGLAMAYPLHEPRVFLIRAGEGGLSIAFSLGLSAETEKFPRRASFRFVLYGADPGWGIRSALDRYYSFFPELFASPARRHGNFGFFFLSNLADRPEDFGFAYMENDFQWKNGEMSGEQAAAADRLGVRVVHWRNPWVSHTPLEDPISAVSNAAPREFAALLSSWAAGGSNAASRKAHAQDCGVSLMEQAGAGLNSHLCDEKGGFIRGFYDGGASKPYWVTPMNMDPDLLRPNRFSISTDWQYRYIREWTRPGFRGPRGVAWDATDDFDGFRRLNFRRDHFRTADTPLTFDPETGLTCQVKGFHDWEFASRFTPRARAAGGIVMANTTIEHSMMFLGPWIDVFVRERKIADNDEERLSVMRALAGRKPVSFIGQWQPRDEAGLKAAFHKTLLFGIAPGAVGCKPDRKEAEDAERAVLGSRMPVFSAMAGAGWEPVTHARAVALDVERFGSKAGNLYFAVRNRSGSAVKGAVAVDVQALGLGDAGGLAFREVLEGRPVKTRVADGRPVVETELAAGETLVVKVEPERPGQRTGS